MKNITLLYNSLIWLVVTILVQVSFSEELSLLGDPILKGNKADTAVKFLEAEELRDSATVILERLYFSWKRLQNRNYCLLDLALSQNISTTQIECKDRTTLYQNVFPNITIETKTVQDEIIIEKYFTEIKNITPSPLEIEAVYNDLVTKYPFTPPKQETIYPILRSKALFSMDTVNSLITQIISIRRKERKERLAKSEEPWSIEEISINADSQQCLVTDSDNASCLVSVEDFNVFSIKQPIPREIRLDSARSMLLNMLLKDLYLSRKIKDKSIINHAIIDKQIKIVESKTLQQWHPNFDQYDDQLLMNIYDKYYCRFFCEKEEKKRQYNRINRFVIHHFSL
ncbi:MAG: hypothetical protein JW915_00260 [Chitinispirillaceae bacterium]|nr:hypothetical protein [Chitinispirillaceae bacterium]